MPWIRVYRLSVQLVSKNKFRIKCTTLCRADIDSTYYGKAAKHRCGVQQNVYIFHVCLYVSYIRLYILHNIWFSFSASIPVYRLAVCRRLQNSCTGFHIDSVFVMCTMCSVLCFHAMSVHKNVCIQPMRLYNTKKKRNKKDWMEATDNHRLPYK